MPQNTPVGHCLTALPHRKASSTNKQTAAKPWAADPTTTLAPTIPCCSQHPPTPTPTPTHPTLLLAHPLCLQQHPPGRNRQLRHPGHHIKPTGAPQQRRSSSSTPSSTRAGSSTQRLRAIDQAHHCCLCGRRQSGGSTAAAVIIRCCCWGQAGGACCYEAQQQMGCGQAAVVQAGGCQAGTQQRLGVCARDRRQGGNSTSSKAARRVQVREGV